MTPFEDLLAGCEACLKKASMAEATWMRAFIEGALVVIASRLKCGQQTYDELREVSARIQKHIEALKSNN